MKRFCRFLAETFHLERLANLAPKHIQAYVAYLQEQERAPSTIKTDLAAIRFFHDLIPEPRYLLPGNESLNLERRSYGDVDRTWTDTEFQRMLALAQAAGREDFVSIMLLGRYAALRIHECFRIDTATAWNAIKDYTLTIKGKGGLVRTIPLNHLLVSHLVFHISKTVRGHKLFVPDERQTHAAIKSLQAFLHANQKAAREPGTGHVLTFHGLRHTCAVTWYLNFRKDGKSPYEARKAVSRLLGHGRDDVTRIYLGSLERRV